MSKHTISCTECSQSSSGGCPFNFFSEKSEYAQNAGCLPTPMDIVNMRVVHGKTWACHSNPDKPCLGAINYLIDKGLPHRVLDNKLVTENDDWSKYLLSFKET